MNRKDIIRMAQETGVTAERVRDLVNFAALVASAEREACAKVCDDLDDDIVDGLAGWQYAEAIRARGNVATNDTSQERVDETTKQRHDTTPQPVIDKSAAVRIATALGWTPQRTWVGLTDEEILKIYSKPCGSDYIDYARAIEAKLKEKNT